MPNNILTTNHQCNNYTSDYLYVVVVVVLSSVRVWTYFMPSLLLINTNLCHLLLTVCVNLTNTLINHKLLVTVAFPRRDPMLPFARRGYLFFLNFHSQLRLTHCWRMQPVAIMSNVNCTTHWLSPHHTYVAKRHNIYFISFLTLHN